MIELTRRLAKELRTVIRRALGISHGAAPPLRVSTGPEGLCIQARKYSSAVAYHVPGTFDNHDLMVPAQALDDLQGSKAEPASLYRRREGVVGATWEERGVTRHVEYAEPSAEESEFPAPPEKLARNPPRLRGAFNDAFETADTASSRYALGCIQLRGDQGSVTATDGRQLLLQRGYVWGFDETVLIPKTALFGCKDLGDEHDVWVGRRDNQLLIRIGPWTFWLPIETEGRFPRVDDAVPAAAGADTVWELAPADAQFLAENLNRLPGGPDERKVTVELNSSVAIRAQTADSPQGTELVLRNSTRTGADVLVGLDRRNLLRAATLGFDKIYLRGPSAALLAEDATRAFVWMPLSDEQLTRASEHLLRIESPGSAAAASRPFSRRRRPKTMEVPTPPPTATRESTSPRKSNREPASDPSATGSLAQSILIRDRLRAELVAVKELIRTLQSERKTQKTLQATLASLRKLPTAA